MNAPPPRQPRKRGRPRLPEEKRREQAISVRFRPEELEQVAEAARPFSLSVGAYARRLLLGTRPHPPRLPREVLALVGELNRIGNNLNQLVKLIHQHRAPAGLLAAVRQCLAVLTEACELLDPGREAKR